MKKPCNIAVSKAKPEKSPMRQVFRHFFGRTAKNIILEAIRRPFTEKRRSNNKNPTYFVCLRLKTDEQNIITLSNPGNSRIEIDTAISGGVSDPRNSTMLKMFNFIDIGERAGSGIPNIFRVWKEQKWNNPIISESYEPDRITLSLPLSPIKSDDKKVTIKSDDKKVTIKVDTQKNIIIEYLTVNPEGTISDFSELLSVSSTRTKQIMYLLVDENIVEPIGGNRNRKYRLKR